ncbi:SET domain-containing protein [Mariniflexile sp. AS56]|uniref:SET domain-containing protein n=1 Tax=Mariniflexile sp. AS56 TaxID=3063957 RepID=UPI0026F34480|nr:SET domain-containing protein-lysine N-methyltransferase [Mariniflexile sp. AS56]MDO7173012.1 SET domain-containing protein-lysine N-methyltransferase [Mariniflexile sp. AS56]
MTNIVEVKQSPVHGKGVFASRNIAKGELLAKCDMALIHVNENLPEVLATLQFPWIEEYDAICISDVGSFFNHSGTPTAEVDERDFDNLIQTFIAKTDIVKGTEVTIYYNDAFEEFVSK